MVGVGDGIYDPKTETYSSLVSDKYFPVEWDAAGMAISADRKSLLVAGGGFIETSMDSACMFDLEHVERGCRSVAPMLSPRLGPWAHALPDGRFFVLGGYVDGDDTLPNPKAEIYDPASNTWSPFDAPTWSYGIAYHRAHGVVLPDGRWFLLDAGGGFLLDPKTLEWTAASSPRTTGSYARYLIFAQAIGDGRVLVAGGFGDWSNHNKYSSLYDPKTDTWTSPRQFGDITNGSPYPVYAFEPGCDRIFMLTLGPGGDVVPPHAFVFVPALDRWVEVPNPPTWFTPSAGGVAVDQNRVLMGFGYFGSKWDDKPTELVMLQRAGGDGTAHSELPALFSTARNDHKRCPFFRRQ